MSQEQVAGAMAARGYSWHQATVYKVENGGRQIQLSEADALAQVFKVPLAQLVGSTSEATEVARLVRRAQDLRIRRHELIDARALWMEARERLSAVAENRPQALSALPDHEQFDIERMSAETVEDVLKWADDGPL